MNTEKKEVYVVLGMARSGTSVIARGLKALGIDLGEKLLAENDLWNPKGFWEDKDIVYRINRRILEVLGQAWMSIDLVSLKNEKVSDIKNLAIKLLNERLVSTKAWGFKDPRTARLLPFWQDVFAAMNLHDKYIISLRNPLASASSYQRVGGGEIEIGLLLWVMHLISAIEGTHGKERVMVSYDMLLSSPSKQLDRIQQALGIPGLADESERKKYATDFLDKKLQHYEYTDEDLKKHPACAVVPICIKMNDFFQKIARDEIAFDSAEFTSGWKEVMQEFNQVFPAYDYIDKLLKRNKQWEREMRTIKKSLPWKLIYPLRLIDDGLRSLRIKVRTKRRLNDFHAK